MTTHGTRLQIGPKLRQRRRALGLTLEDVAVRTDLTKGFLSEIERDRTSPSVASLVRVCEALDIPVGNLFAGPHASVVRADDRAPISFGGHGLTDFMITPSNARCMLGILSQMAPSGGSGPAKYSVKSEEEFVFVLSGTVRVEVEGDSFDLGPGDALTYDPRRPHSFRNASNTDTAEALFLLSPPLP